MLLGVLAGFLLVSAVITGLCWCTLSNSIAMSVVAQTIVSGVVAFNWVLQVKFVPTAWPAPIQLLGHALLVLQISCLLRCVLTPQLKLPNGWEAAAAAGVEPAEMCRKSERLLPPRARYLRRRDQVILGFDHYCVRTPKVRTCASATLRIRK